VAVLAADPPLERRVVGRLREHLRVVVAFEQQGLAPGQMVQHMGGGVAQIGQDAQCAAPSVQRSCSGSRASCGTVNGISARSPSSIAPVARQLQQPLQILAADAA
jgi:hypothetical protein